MGRSWEGAVPEVLRRIYAAGLDESRWPEAMAAIHRLFPGVGMELLRHDLALGGATSPLSVGYDPAEVARYNAHYGALNPWTAGFGRHPPGTVLSADALCPHAELVRTEFWADWVRPQGDLSAGAGVLLTAGPGHLLAFGGNLRRRDRDRDEGPWMAFLAVVGPALAHAFEVNRMLAGLRLDRQLLRRGADPDEAAVIVLDRGLRGVWWNEAGGAALAEGGLVRRGPTGLVDLVSAAGQAALRRALLHGHAEAALGPDPLAPVRLRIVTLDEEAVPLLPLGWLPATALPLLALVLRARPRDADLPDRLARRLGLTPAEAAVVAALADGQGPAEIAEGRRVSAHTVRNQIKAVRAKLGARRQSDIVRIVERLRAERG